MRKALLLPLAFISIFIAGCDNGIMFKSEQVPSKLKVLIERQNEINKDDRLVIYAMDFHKEGRTLTFVCPCYIPGSFDRFLNVKIESDSFKLSLLPDAEYNVKVTYWAPNFDNNANVQFRISR